MTSRRWSVQLQYWRSMIFKSSHTLYLRLLISMWCLQKTRSHIVSIHNYLSLKLMPIHAMSICCTLVHMIIKPFSKCIVLTHIHWQWSFVIKKIMTTWYWNMSSKILLRSFAANLIFPKICRSNRKNLTWKLLMLMEKVMARKTKNQLNIFIRRTLTKTLIGDKFHASIAKLIRL